MSQNDSIRHLVCLLFKRISWLVDFQFALNNAASILCYMCQLMRQQSFSNARPQVIMPCPKHHILSNCVGKCIHCPRRLGRPGVCMYPHLAKVLTEARLEEGARLRIERLAGRTQCFVDYGRYFRNLRTISRIPLQRLPLPEAFFFLAFRPLRPLQKAGRHIGKWFLRCFCLSLKLPVHSSPLTVHARTPPASPSC